MVFLNGKCVALLIVNHYLVASNPLTGEVWYLQINPGGLWSVDVDGKPVARFYNPRTRHSFDGLVVCPD